MRLLDFREEGVGQGFFNGDAEIRVDLKHPIDQVNALWRCTWVLLSEVDSFDGNKALKVADCLLVSDE